MYNTKQITRFLQLRAQNHSYDNLSALLNIPKRTLLRWGKEYAGKIEMLKKRSFDKLFKQLDVTARSRIEMLAKDLKKINKELKNKSYSSIIAIDLLQMKMKLISALSKFDTAVESAESAPFDYNEQPVSDPYDYDEEGAVHIPDSDGEEEEFNREREKRDRIRKRLEEENPGLSEDELDKIEFEVQLNRDLARINHGEDDPNEMTIMIMTTNPMINSIHYSCTVSKVNLSVGQTFLSVYNWKYLDSGSAAGMSIWKKMSRENIIPLTKVSTSVLCIWSNSLRGFYE